MNIPGFWSTVSSEFNSNPREGHPLFIEFIKAGIMNSEKKLSKREVDAGLFRKESMKLLNYEITDKALLPIAGPCVVESEQLQVDTADF